MWVSTTPLASSSASLMLGYLVVAMLKPEKF